MTGAQADTLAELAPQLGIDAAQLEATVREFNAAIRDDVPFDAAVKDGRAAEGIEPPKSHWAQALDTPPYYGFAVTCGVTFTFGGVHIDEHARVLDATARRSPASTRPASSSAACSTATTPAAPASRRARCSAAAPAPTPRASRATQRTPAWRRWPRSSGRRAIVRGAATAT